MSNSADTAPSQCEMEALDIARALADFGVPIFVAPPNTNYGTENGKGGVDERMFIEPSGWQNTVADPAVVDRWRPGYMLAAVTGVKLDVIDTDPRNGGRESRTAVEPWMPTVFGTAKSQQDGSHEWIERVHRRKRSSDSAPLPGLDVLAGDDEGRGRSYVRIPPTRTPLGDYVWTSPPDLSALQACDGTSVERFVMEFFDPMVKAQTAHPASKPYDGHDHSARELAYLAAAIENEIGIVGSAAEGDRNGLLRDAAFNLGQLVEGVGMDEADVTARLTEAATSAGLGAMEIHTTIKSGMAGGMKHPRAVPDVPASDSGDAGRTDVDLDDDGDLVDLVALLDGPDNLLEAPTMLRLADGTALLYPGRLNALIGEPESGKSWLALAAVTEVLRDGGTVLYMDHEDSPRGILHRLTLLGIDRDGLGRLQYSQPEDGAAARSRLLRTAADQTPDLVVLDSMGPFLALIGASSMDNDEVTHSMHRYLYPLTRAGACVVLLDHVVKAKDNRGRFPLGAQSKLANITGACYVVEMIAPLGVGLTGKLKLTVSKDRPGSVRGRRAGSRAAGIAAVTSTPCMVKVVIEAEQNAGSDGFRPDVLMGRVSEFLEAEGTPQSQRSIEEGVTGASKGKRAAIQCLIAEGYAQKVGSAKQSELIRPFGGTAAT